MSTDETVKAVAPAIIGVEVIEWHCPVADPPPHSTTPGVMYTLFLFCTCGCESSRVAASCFRHQGDWYSMGGPNSVLIHEPVKVLAWAEAIKGPKVGLPS